jgi:adenosylcobinamide kinase/adenosylcobinamide-phosphate guanylyltransferase
LLILIGGGSRSGKSRYALEYARRFGSPLAFIATAGLLDDEMRARAAAHQSERGAAFETLEETVEVGAALRKAAGRHQATVIDCLTLWAANVLDWPEERRTEALRDLIVTAAGAPAPVIVVTNEVGCGIVPDNPQARRFRDIAGWANQQVAEAAAEVYWMVFGVPLRVK